MRKLTLAEMKAVVAKSKGLAAVPSAEAKAEGIYPCRHRLAVISKTDAAGLECSCPGKWLRACAIHAEGCRIDQESNEACCRTCDDRPAAPSSSRLISKRDAPPQ